MGFHSTSAGLEPVLHSNIPLVALNTAFEVCRDVMSADSHYHVFLEWGCYAD